MRQLKRADFDTAHEYEAAKRARNKGDKVKRSGREARRISESAE